MNGLKEICKCGHDRATHFDKKETCLAMNCACRAYRDASAPDAPDTIRPSAAYPIQYRKPHADLSCDCSGCLLWYRANRGM